MVYRGKVSRYYLIHLIAPPSTFESSKEDLVQSFRQSFWTCELGKSDLPLDGFDLVIIMRKIWDPLWGRGIYFERLWYFSENLVSQILPENLFRRNRDSFWRIYFGGTVGPFEGFNTSFKHISKGFFFKESYKSILCTNNFLNKKICLSSINLIIQ